MQLPRRGAIDPHADEDEYRDWDDAEEESECNNESATGPSEEVSNPIQLCGCLSTHAIYYSTGTQEKPPVT